MAFFSAASTRLIRFAVDVVIFGFCAQSGLRWLVDIAIVPAKRMMQLALSQEGPVGTGQ
jgi:hypothetical protein